MFRQRIGDGLTFSNGQASRMFPHIYGGNFMNDSSFVATLRALLHHRIGSDQSVCVIQSSSSMPTSSINDASMNEFLRNTINHFGDCNTIHIHNIRGSAESVQATLDKFSELPAHYTSFEAAPDITEYMKKKMAIRVYVNKAIRSTIIVVANMNLPRYHLIQILIPRYLPWFFANDTDKLTQEEYELLKSLSLNEPATYENLMEKIASTVDFRGELIRTIVGGFMKRSIDTRIVSIERTISGYRNELSDITDRYNRLLEAITQNSYTVLGLKASKENAGSANDELVDYFVANKNLIPVGDGSDSDISFVVNTYLDIVDPEAYKRIADNKRSYIYSVAASYGWSNEDAKMLFDAIFSEEPTLRIKTCGYYRLNINGRVDSYRGYNYPSECNDHIPNPHLHYYNCLGGHMAHISDCLSRGDIVGAVIQCISSARSLNIIEETTARHAIENVLQSDRKAIELPDGTCMTSREALEWLKDQQNSKEGCNA